MDASFWHKCWERNYLGFHQESVHPFLQTYLAPQLTASDQHVFVPLCGKSLDMVWLAENMKVTGAELSEIACRDFFEEKGLTYQIKTKGKFKIFSFDEISLYQGDFFELTSQSIEPIDWVYDRAALIALPESLQQQYVEHLFQFIPDSATLMLITLEFPQHELEGPPFAIFPSVVEKLFAGYQIDYIAENELKCKRFAQSTFKVSKLVERLYCIKKK